MKKIKEKDFQRAVINSQGNENILSTTDKDWIARECFELALQMCDEREEQVRKQIQKDLDKLFKNG